MSKDERKEVLEFLRADIDRRMEEERNGNGLFDQIMRYTDTLSKEDRKRFYLDLDRRWARIAEEGLKMLDYQNTGKSRVIDMKSYDIIKKE